MSDTTGKRFRNAILREYYDLTAPVFWLFSGGRIRTLLFQVIGFAFAILMSGFALQSVLEGWAWSWHLIWQIPFTLIGFRVAAVYIDGYCGDKDSIS